LDAETIFELCQNDIGELLSTTVEIIRDIKK